MSKNIYEFLLWANCNNHCTFCHQRLFAKNGRILTYDEKSDSIQQTLDYVYNKMIKGSHIMLCGGELFDNANDKPLLTYLFESLVEPLRKNYIDIVYLNTNLIYENPSVLFDCLDILSKNDCLHHVNFTTSYDLKGRFITKSREKLFDRNFILLDDIFPTLNRITNMIMTKDMCKAILAKEFSLERFVNHYNTHINLIPYIRLVDELAPSKQEVLDTLREANRQLPGYLVNYRKNLTSNPTRFVFEYVKDKGFVDSSSNNNSCGHSVNFTKVFDDGSCFICELGKLL